MRFRHPREWYTGNRRVAGQTTLCVVASADTLTLQLAWYTLDLLCTNRLGATYGGPSVSRLKARETVFIRPLIGRMEKRLLVPEACCFAPVIIELLAGLESFAAWVDIVALTNKVRNVAHVSCSAHSWFGAEPENVQTLPSPFVCQPLSSNVTFGQTPV